MYKTLDVDVKYNKEEADDIEVENSLRNLFIKLNGVYGVIVAKVKTRKSNILTNNNKDLISDSSYVVGLHFDESLNLSSLISSIDIFSNDKIIPVTFINIYDNANTIEKTIIC